MARRKSYVKGASRVKKLLKRLPDDIGTEILNIYRTDGQTGLAYARGSTPKKTGRLAASLSMKIYPKTLRLRIGQLQSRKGLFGDPLFYGRILEFGRKAQTVTVRRRAVAGSALVNGRRVVGTTYQLRVSPISRSAYDIVQGRVAKFVFGLIRPKLVVAYERALSRAQGAVGNAD